MIRCPECNRKNEDNRKYCSLCGTDLTEARREASKHQKINFYDKSLSTRIKIFLFYKHTDFGYEIAKTKIATYIVFILMSFFYIFTSDFANMDNVEFYSGIFTILIFTIVTYVIGIICRKFLSNN